MPIAPSRYLKYLTSIDSVRDQIFREPRIRITQPQPRAVAPVTPRDPHDLFDAKLGKTVKALWAWHDGITWVFVMN